MPWRGRFDLVDRTTAFNHIHRPAAHGRGASRPAAGWPSTSCSASSWPWSCASARLERDARGIRHSSSRDGRARPWSTGSSTGLPFRLTGAQQRAIAAIRDDLAGPLPMHRLLQGDVGSGKTVVAVAAMLVAVEGGHQGALMAPTEVLAEQHAAEVRALLAGLTVPDDRHARGPTAPSGSPC